MERVNAIIKKMSHKEKASLLVGKDFWHTQELKRHQLPSIVVSDGPFGLRKVENQGLNALETSRPATAFPTTSALASSFDDDLIKEVGTALAKECLDQGVDILLGPGLNIKRHPLCGRNFEYFSEDPYLSGRLSTALVEAIQAQGVGACVKHFAVNNQETKRLFMNAIVDERALHEIYLRGFEMVIKQAKPWAVMCSYNQVNGLHASRNYFLLKEMLRNRYGFSGLVMSDWGAVVDLADSIKAGLNLEMPGGAYSPRKISKELSRAGIKENEINEAIKPLLKLMVDKRDRYVITSHDIHYGDHHNLAVKVATEAAVLLKNDEKFLPLKVKKNIAVIGNFALNPRYQGSGSSRINPRLLEGLHQALTNHQIDFEYADGYGKNETEIDSNKIEEAVQVAKDKDVVILMVGLPDEYEMEGLDRSHLNLPDSHNRLIEEIAKVNKNIVIVLSSGSPVLMPWLKDVKALLHMHLAGQGSGEAIYQLVYGLVNPSGKLAETYPLKLEDVPSHKYFGNRVNIEYRESIYVGYRYYLKAEKPVLFPFGFGLSYTTFSYKDVELSHPSFDDNESITVKVTIKNSGKVAGAEVVQLYVGPRKTLSFQAPQNLRNFKKVFLNPGEEQSVEFTLTKDDFALFDVESQSYRVENGSYKLFIGSSSQDIRLTRMIKIDSEFELKDQSEDLPSYYHLGQGDFEVTFNEFNQLYGKKIKHFYAPTKRPFNSANTLNDTKGTAIGRFIIKKISGMIKDMAGGDPLTEQVMVTSFLDAPIRSYSAFSGGAISKRQIRGIVNILNLRLISGLFRLIPTPKQAKLLKSKDKAKKMGSVPKVE